MDMIRDRGVVIVLAFVLLGGVLLFNSFRTATSANVATSLQPPTAFSGGPFEASGVAHVPGTTGVLFVDDGRPDEIFWMAVSEDRTQNGPIKSIQLGVSVIDLEGITTDGPYFYVVGSQSKSKGGDLAGLVRFRFNSERQSIEGVEAISGLKKFLADNVAELNGMSDKKYSEGGINVEGIAWDPKSKRLLLGLRSPVVDGNALIVPLRLRDPLGAFSQENLMVEDSKSIKLPLGGAGIRSIEYDESRNAFAIITGAAANAEKADFKLWEWNGDAANPTLRETDTFDRKLKPEGITRVTANGREFTFIVFDTSRYAAMD
jgi:Protein of unknown function (DUF3616)